MLTKGKENQLIEERDYMAFDTEEPFFLEPNKKLANILGLGHGLQKGMVAVQRGRTSPSENPM